MPSYTGQFGVVKTASNAIGQVKSFSVSTTADTADSTYQGLEWKENKTLQKSWSGSLTALWDNTDPGQIELSLGAELVLTLQPAGTATGAIGAANELSGTAIITGIEYPSDMASMIETSISFIGDGILNQSVSS